MECVRKAETNGESTVLFRELQEVEEIILNESNPAPEPTVNVDTNGETEESCILSSVKDVSVDNDQLQDTPLEDDAVAGS